MSRADLICHYTSLDGFMSIVESRKIWATNVAFLNDSKEYFHSFNIFRSALDHFREQVGSKSKVGRYFIAGIERSMDGFNQIGAETHFVTSFSENLDQLSQWRAYGSVGIVFNTKKFEESIVGKVSGLFHIDRCNYNQEDLEREFYSSIKSLFNAYKEGYSEKGKYFIFDLITDKQIDLYDTAAFVKDSGFREEAEVRLSYAIGGNEEFKFRNTGYYLIPYVEIPFDIEAIDSVILGPCVDPERVKSSVDLFLKNRIPVNTPLAIHSKVPYRSW